MWIVSAQNVSAAGAKTGGLTVNYKLTLKGLCDNTFESSNEKAVTKKDKKTCWVNGAKGYVLLPLDQKVSLVVPAKATDGKSAVTSVLAAKGDNTVTFAVTLGGDVLKTAGKQVHSVLQVGYAKASAAESTEANAVARKTKKDAEKKAADKKAADKKAADAKAGEAEGKNASFVHALLVALFM